MIEDDKALHTSAFHQKMALHARPCRPFVPSGNRCRAAHHDTATHRQMGKNGVTNRAGGVVEIHVDAIRARRCNTNIGRASCRGRGWQYGEIWGVDVSLKKKKT